MTPKSLIPIALLLTTTLRASAIPAPLSGTATPAGPATIALHWQVAANDKSEFEIERHQGDEQWQPLVQRLPKNTNHFYDRGLSATSTWHYRIRSTAGAEKSDWLDLGAATTTIKMNILFFFADDMGFKDIVGLRNPKNRRRYHLRNTATRSTDPRRPGHSQLLTARDRAAWSRRPFRTHRQVRLAPRSRTEQQVVPRSQRKTHGRRPVRRGRLTPPGEPRQKTPRQPDLRGGGQSRRLPHRLHWQVPPRTTRRPTRPRTCRTGLRCFHRFRSRRRTTRIILPHRSTCRFR